MPHLLECHLEPLDTLICHTSLNKYNSTYIHSYLKNNPCHGVRRSCKQPPYGLNWMTHRLKERQPGGFSDERWFPQSGFYESSSNPCSHSGSVDSKGNESEPCCLINKWVYVHRWKHQLDTECWPNSISSYVAKHSIWLDIRVQADDSIQISILS